MPVAIVISTDEVIPAVIEESSESALLSRLRSLTNAPHLDNAATAKEWLFSLPQPSGWYDTPAAALAYLRRAQQDEPALSGDDVKRARETLGLARNEFAARLGFGGNDQTRHSAIFKIEKGERPIGTTAAQRLRALLAEHKIPQD